MLKKRLKYRNAELILDTRCLIRVVTRENSITADGKTQQRQQCFASVIVTWGDVSLSNLRDDDSLLLLSGNERFAFKSLAMCGHEWTLQSRFHLRGGEHPQLGHLDQLHIIGRIKTKLAIIQATFTPPLIVFVLQFRQQITLIDKQGQRAGGGFNERPLFCILQLTTRTWKEVAINDPNLSDW